MAIRIGRHKGSRGVYIPANRGMGDRANKQLDAHAAAHAEKFREALKIDGPLFAFWRKTQGSIPCSCSAHRDPASLYADVAPGEENKTHTSSIGSDNKNKRKKITYVGNQSASTGHYGDKNSIEEDKVDKLTNRNKKEFLDIGDFPDEEDILDALDGPGNNLTKEPSLMDFDDPFNLFGGKLIECPICFGEGYQNAWQLHNGLRTVLDTSNAYNFHSKRCTIDNSSSGPAIIEAQNKAEVYWTYKLPTYFLGIVRVRVYNGIEVIDPSMYSLEFITEENVTGEVNEIDLNNLIGVDTTLTIVWKNLTDEELKFTHAEIVLTFAPFEHCQIPDIEMAYEQQFLDWNVSTQVELPPGLDIKEGDYLNDDKYQRVWKINSINRRITSSGVEFGTSADIRVLHSFEKLFTVLEIF